MLRAASPTKEFKYIVVDAAHSVLPIPTINILSLEEAAMPNMRA
jgi:hypothetical protein